MLPGGVLSTQPHPGPFAEPVNKRREPLIDYEMGGVALDDPGQGLRVKLWTLRCIGGAVSVESEGIEPVTLFTRSGSVTEVSFAFDQNMRPQVAFVEDDLAWLWWFDTLANDYRFTSYPGIVSPRLALDEKRPRLLAIGDVIFTYIKDGALCYRQQRDRYAVEYVLKTGLQAGLRLVAVGRNVGGRLQWQAVGGGS